VEWPGTGGCPINLDIHQHRDTNMGEYFSITSIKSSSSGS
jgi:hypothetical protein